MPQVLRIIMTIQRTVIRVILVWVTLSTVRASHAQQVMDSWRDSPSRKAIVDFVIRVTTEGHADFLPVERRIAVFDNDGTLWSEQPMYVQLSFALDRVAALAQENPSWSDRQPFQAALDRDLHKIAESGEAGLMQLILATHAGMTTEDFSKISLDWITKARHPIHQRPFTECVYQPMLELLNFLRERGFKTYIVSGGGVEFMRPWTEKVYGIPPSQVIGSSIKVKYENRDGKSMLVRLPEIDFIDDKSGKPVAIHKFIGQRPVLAVGNSDGDYEMLEYVTSGSGPSLGVLVHHTDEQRESRYDRNSLFGRLDRALNDAPSRGWVVIDMKEDWREVFPVVPGRLPAGSGR